MEKEKCYVKGPCNQGCVAGFAGLDCDIGKIIQVSDKNCRFTNTRHSIQKINSYFKVTY